MRRVMNSRASWIVFLSMMIVVVVAMAASITLAAMYAYDYGQNTVRIAGVGEVSCTTTVPAKVYPGGSGTADVQFALAKGQYDVSKVNLSDFKLTSFTLNWGADKSKTFNQVTTTAGTSTVVTPAGKWQFALSFGADGTLTASTNKTATLTITAPLGAPSSDNIYGGSPEDGYLVGSVTSITCDFTLLVDPIEY